MDALSQDPRIKARPPVPLDRPIPIRIRIRLTVTTSADGLPLLMWHGSMTWIYLVGYRDAACSAGTERVLEADTDGDTAVLFFLQYFGHESLDYVAFDGALDPPLSGA